MTPLRVVRNALVISGVASLASAGLLTGALLGAPVASATGEVSPTTVTVGTGPFAGMSVSVSQTEALTSQVVEVRWSGAAPTQPTYGILAHSYVAIMQCWGDDPEGTPISVTPGLETPSDPAAAYGPDRTQCQYGRSADERGGYWANTREVNPNTFIDPLETLPRNVGTQTFVPFESATGVTITNPLENVYFDANTTNEVDYGRTRPDGQGLEYVEIQTLRQAPGLGCGEALTPVDGSVKGRSCWLVLVPRSDLEVDGRTVGTSSSNRLDSSPLSASNWRNRIVLPLDFVPIGQTCPIGARERRITGSEVATDAVTRWQPALCEDGTRVFGFSEVSDASLASQLSSTTPGLALVNGRVDVKGSVFAPVAVSGVGIGFILERRVDPGAPADEQEKAGERLTSLKLNARLVAKLLTQSYRGGLADGVNHADHLGANPFDLSGDPEFLALNPEFATMPAYGLSDMLVPTGSSLAYQKVWEWIKADLDASLFMMGMPDEWGMTVNPYYIGSYEYAVGDSLVTRSNYPKLDETCADPIDPANDASRLCITAARPYAANLEESARSGARGDTLAQSTWDPIAVPPRFKKTGVQPPGSRAMLVLTTTPLAGRYGLGMAELKNLHGDFVAPDADSLRAAVDAAPVHQSTGVQQPDPTSTAAGTYPLAVVTYAATVPGSLTMDEAEDYAAFIRFVTQKGQRSGDTAGSLPAGYVPLGNEQSVAADRIAEVITSLAQETAEESQGSQGEDPSPSPTPTTSASSDSGADPSGTPTPTVDSPSPPAFSEPAAAESSAAVPAAGTGSGSDGADPARADPAPATMAFASIGSGVTQSLVLVLLVLGMCGVCGGLLLTKLSKR